MEVACFFTLVMMQSGITTLSDLLALLPQGTPPKATESVSRAYLFAQEIHAGERRASGELYIEHDLGVAQVLIRLGVDTPTIVAGLLHDSLSAHTNKKEADLRELFGEEATTLIVGVNRLYAYAEQQTHKNQATAEENNLQLETIRRAILTIIEGDIRVILIRMADCLQDLRKASTLKQEQQLLIANEAMNIYAPLANRLGVWQLKWELEDLAFRYLEPETYHEIASKLAERRAGRAQRIEQATERLDARLKEMGLKAVVTGRPKHIYSIARKMKRKQVNFEQIFDVHALRVILEPANKEAYAQLNVKEKDEIDRNLCYQVLGAVHSLWQPIPKEFDDYIASPKANGYKSLHTAVIDNLSGQTLEVQIRTARMHEEAEKGIAAHWAYKEDGARVTASVQRRIQNLRELLAALREVGDPTTDTEIFETELLAERIYAFTPRGDVVDLPAGSTPIDFAYQIHTEVGHRCRGARVDGKMVSLDYKLKSGQRVEILTSKRGGPSRDWMNASLGYTGSARTRSKVRQWFRALEREQNILQGREVVERELKRLGLSDVYSVNDIAEALKYDDVDSFLAKVGFGDIQSAQISGAIAILKQNLQPDDELRPLLQEPRKPRGLTVRGLSGLYTKMARCCNPIPPEKIIGYITRGQGVTIHRKDCKQVEAITERERLIEVDWGSEEERFPIPIVVKAYRRPGLVDEMAGILRGQHITSPKTKTTTNGSILTVYLVAEVISLEQLNWLLQKFENLPNVIEAHRQRWT
ncbi:MAG: bifunctional (p)ppGpp synthetase/guanosine-3',5'-bis(diphosphate) 3'-pyrophosphohydrolase [Ardenticatenaceae bacterium]|nr:bifunctional (p)ppGpp synthetase/guanosine-3',5'-bis(diphosphate) 3'-pyrophosphohydrolase [Ardenticatenaceae bacterium]MCB8988536.1 bifunctional (p)ppGpp synthetase/guanosine-3',5'-bis(diphosphate) 3'-pyrophosphohydrolase [Ardenticatenaceae bacterium]